ncbi:MAG: MBL fold metallo-hydrolase [Gemmatimonadetes bacterium]|nr:MBL fold metallo-hydrolase [Gemmatimonadota bacterium]
MRRWVAIGLSLGLAGPAWSQSGGRPPGAEYQGRGFEFRPVAPGVYLAVGTGKISAESNAVIIEGDRDLLVVDSETSPAAAWALLQELRAVTPKPVKTVVLTHFHYDHAHGTQSFPPGVEVIATEYTKAMLAEGKSMSHPTAAGNRSFASAQVGNATRALDTASTPAVRRELAERREVWQRYLASIATLKPVVPNVTLTGRLTLSRGGREIVILHPGPAHTAGDLVVWLPAERILVTGDLIQPNLPYMGDGFFPGWADAIDSLLALRPAVVLPGHGDAMSDMTRVERQRDYLRDIYAQTATLKREGLAPDEVARRLDLTKYDADYPRPPGWTDEIVVRRRLGTVRRIFEVIDGR